MNKEEILNLLQTEYLSGQIDIKEVKKRIGVSVYWSSEYAFSKLGIYEEFKKIQNKRRGLSAKKTNLKLYGVANGKNKNNIERAKTKSLNQYGVEYSSQRPEVKNKVKQSKLLKYGDANYTNRTKCLQTMQTKYGINNCSQLPDWYNKVKQTKLSRYGKETYNNSIKMRLTKKSKNAQFELENKCISIQKFIKKYGHKCYAIIEKLKLELLSYNNNYFIYKKDKDILINYLSKITEGAGQSYIELDLIDYIKTFYFGNIRHNDRKAISPKELDIYIPELKIGIEYNGTYWHSIENGNSKEIHLNKSLLCRKKGIRLIHIYEFEDIEKQKLLLKNLILGIDEYPKDDFNKNNLIDTIPEPEIIYNDTYTIYGAGKLY